MSTRRCLVLDANILVRAVFGTRVRDLIETYQDSSAFCAPDICFEDARRYIPEIAGKRSFDPEAGLLLLDQLARVILVVDRSFYADYETAARQRIHSRDVEDWPIVATSLLLNCPVWTEDQDFFGSGIATWLTSNVEIYLRNA
jgi:predicted nucleic acid-binding protein